MVFKRLIESHPLAGGFFICGLKWDFSSELQPGAGNE
jgi:hypothetical protein